MPRGFKPNRDGIGDLLRDRGVLRELERRGEEIADRARSAGIMVSGEPGQDELPIRVVSSIGRTRARVRVVIAHPAGLAVEAKHRLLGRSI